jgi:hypothetical protein
VWKMHFSQFLKELSSPALCHACDI